MFIKITIRLLTLITFLFAQTLYAKYVMHDAIVLKTKQQTLTYSKIRKDYKINDTIDNNLKMKNFDKNSILQETLYNAMTLTSENNNCVKLNSDRVAKIFYYTASFTSRVHFSRIKKIIELRKKFTENDIVLNYSNNIKLEKLQYKATDKDPNVSMDEIKEFAELVNYVKINSFLHEFYVLELVILRKRDRTLKNLKNIFQLLKKTNNINIIKNYSNIQFLRVKNIHLTDKNKYYYPIKNIVAYNKHKKIIGPLFLGGSIYIYKITKKIHVIKRYEPHIKVSYRTIKRDVFKTEKIFQQIERLTTKENEKNIKNSVYQARKSYWIRRDNIHTFFYKDFNKLKLDKISNVIKSDLGWHMLKIADKTIDQQTNLITVVNAYLRMDKAKKISADILTKKFIKEDDLIHYNENDRF